MARRKVSEGQTIEALGDAVTRAIHHAPESLLRNFQTGDRDLACRRLSLRVVTQLGGDGWAGDDADALDDAVAVGIGRAGEHFLTSLAAARQCNGKLLDGIGVHIGEKIAEAMQEGRARLVRCWTATPRSLQEDGGASAGGNNVRRNRSL